MLNYSRNQELLVEQKVKLKEERKKKKRKKKEGLQEVEIKND
jgi:hypothetical protein